MRAPNEIHADSFKRKETGTEAVQRMRDEFLELVNLYNKLGMYKHAQHAQMVAITLNDFEEGHVITGIAWPPRVVSVPDKHHPEHYHLGAAAANGGDPIEDTEL